MDMSIVSTIVAKDLAEVKKNKMILVPLLVMPIIFAVILPVSTVFGLEEANGEDVALLLYMIGSGMIPLFVLIPAAISNVIAAYSFVGEKTEKTLEPLLATPISDNEVLLGKILAAFIPAMVATIVAFVLLTVIVDMVTYEKLGYVLLPNLIWAIAIFVLAPLIAILSITITIIFSARMNDPRAVQQMSVLIILPFLGLFFGGVAQVITLDLAMMSLMIAALVVANIAVFRLARGLFQRETILTQWR